MNKVDHSKELPVSGKEFKKFKEFGIAKKNDEKKKDEPKKDEAKKEKK